jgi:hypothetical protein
MYPAFGWNLKTSDNAGICGSSDCWIGKETSILRNWDAQNKCIVGYGAIE